MKDRVLALAGLLQCTDAVVAIATQGRCSNDALDTAFASVLRIDASSTAAVFGGVGRLRRGLELVAAHARGNPGSTATQGRIALTVLQVERRLAVRNDLLQRIHDGILSLAPWLDRTDLQSPELQQALGELYAQTVSTLTPRVLVQGDPDLLSRSDIVMRIRALLLAAVRCAVLWRQSGGSYWDFFLRRGAIATTATGWLASIDREADDHAPDSDS